MPIMNFNASVWKCEDDSNGNSKFYSLECFNATHIGYCIVAGLNMLLYISISMTIIFTYFECRFRNEDLTAKVSGRSDAVMQAYIII